MPRASNPFYLTAERIDSKKNICQSSNNRRCITRNYIQLSNWSAQYAAEDE